MSSYIFVGGGKNGEMNILENPGLSIFYKFYFIFNKTLNGCMCKGQNGFSKL